MKEACKQFVIDQLTEIMGESVSFPFSSENVFFNPLPRDYLKSNPFAVCCLIHTDKKKKAPRMMSNVRNKDFTYYTRTYRRYERRILFRVILYAPDFDELHGKPDTPNEWDFDAYKGIVDQFEQRVAGIRVIPDEMDNAIKVELEDSFRPWAQEEVKQTLKRGPNKAIVRIEFIGGIYIQKSVPILKDVNIQPEIIQEV